MNETPVEVVTEAIEKVGQAQVGALTFRSAQEMVDKAREISKILADIITERKLFTIINAKKHVRVEGWTTLGAMLGIVAEEESVIEKEDGSFIATVRLVRQRDGQEVGRGSSECGMDEPLWADRKRYARRSMAVTRATGKAFRLGYSWIIVMAGFSPTPAEEMPSEKTDEATEAQTSDKRTSEIPAEWLPPSAAGTFQRKGYIADVTEKMTKGKPAQAGKKAIAPRAYTMFRFCYDLAHATQRDGFSVSCWETGMAGSLKKWENENQVVEGTFEAKLSADRKQLFYNLIDLAIQREVPEKAQLPLTAPVTDKDIPF